ncbi:hypothetical protein CDIK_3721 [Cucumispora dikerogammari]|nr:hypothetical protein CDIK_3721 [Cucumispora dikerogammari]
MITDTENKTSIYNKYTDVTVQLTHSAFLFLCNTENIRLLCALFNSLILSSLIKKYFFYNDTEYFDRIFKKLILSRIWGLMPFIGRKIKGLASLSWILNCTLFPLFYFFSRATKQITIFFS